MAVPITSLSIHTQTYSVAGIRGCVPASSPSATHKIFAAANCRVDEDWGVGVGNAHHNHILNGAASAAGAIYYLPYMDDFVYSMRLPANPPVGCRKFLTANMSGCRFFVDTIQNSNDIIVYHANTKAHGSPQGSPANSQSGAAGNILMQLHATAQADYRALNPSVVTVDRTMLRKYEYYASGEAQALASRNRGRTTTAPVNNVYTPGQPAEFLGGTTICGFFNAGWQFYYQTWGYVEYDRPGGAAVVAKALFTGHWNKVHKLRTIGTTSSRIPHVVHAANFV
jgi:hypothetical protein